MVLSAVKHLHTFTYKYVQKYISKQESLKISICIY